MPMASPPSSTASASPPASSLHSKNNRGISQLYLYTFLSTLCLLLAVSGSVIVRSFMLRRRYQRRIEEAIAAGALLTPPSLGSRTRQLAEKPKFYDAWVDHKHRHASDSWENITPISAHFLSPTESSNGANERPTESLLDTHIHPSEHNRIPFSPQESRPSLLSIPLRFSEHRQGVNLKSNHPLEDGPVRKLQVSVLVAMPSPRSLSMASITDVTEQSVSESPPHDAIPNVVIGVVRVPYTVKEVP